jgi:hypothetical protein
VIVFKDSFRERCDAEGDADAPPLPHVDDL